MTKLTEVETEVDRLPPAVIATISEIAARDGISKQAVSKKVRELLDLGLAVERNERGHIVSVNLAQYDYLRGRHDDPSKSQRPAAAEQNSPANSYDEALRKRTWYEAERKRLDLEEQIGRLIPVDEIATAVDECGAEIVQIVRQLQNETDAIAAVVAREGSHGLRVHLKQIESRFLAEIAKALRALATRAPAQPAEDLASAL